MDQAMVEGGRKATLDAILRGGAGLPYWPSPEALLRVAMICALNPQEAEPEWREWGWKSVANILANPQEGLISRFNGRRIVFGRLKVLLRKAGEASRDKAEGKSIPQSLVQELEAEAQQCLKTLRRQWGDAMREAATKEEAGGLPRWTARKTFEVAQSSAFAAKWAILLLRDEDFQEERVGFFCIAILEVLHAGMLAQEVSQAVVDLRKAGTAWPICSVCEGDC